MNEALRRAWGRAFEAACLAAAAAVLVVVAATAHPAPARAPLILFAALLVWAENAAVLLPTKVGISPSFMVVVASLAAFNGRGSMLGASLVGLCGGIAFDKVRHRRFWNVGFNCAQYVIAGAAAAGAELLLRHTGMPHWAALTIGSLAFALLNIGLVLPAVALETGTSPRQVWSDMAPAVPNYVAFGLFGVLIGELYSRFGPLSVAVMVGPLVVARSFFVALLKLRQAYAKLEGLYGFTRSVGSAIEVADVVASTITEAAKVLRAGRVEVALVGGPNGVTLYRADAGGAVQGLGGDLAMVGIAGRVLDTGRALRISAATADVGLRDLATSQAATDVIAVPVRGDDGMLGAIVVLDRADGTAFDTDDLQTLLTLANHAGVALQNGRLIDRVRYDSHHDALTGLLNRAGFQAAVDEATVDPSRKAAVLLMDLSRFKEINDTLGHDSGDAVLQQVGHRLAAVAYPKAIVARLGGDEFAVLLGDRGSATVDDLAAPLLAVLDHAFPVGDLNLEVGASLGVAMFPEHGRDSVTLVQRADIAMYAAKESMRSYESYHPEHDQHTPHRLMLAADLRRAIDRGELTVYYQPKAELPSGRIGGVEALLRWCHPVHGFVPPDEFIPLAEHTGFIRTITRWTLAEAAAQCASWRRKGLDLTVAVNLSARALVDLDLPEQVSDSLTANDLPTGALILEITESSIMTDPERNIGVLERLAEMGICLSIDDFGTGYSSLAYLKRLPVKEVKVDKTFVINLANDTDDAAIVRSTIDLARNLRLRVVAEGVEDRQVWDQLCAMGCDVAQGYVLTRPVPAAAFERWLSGYDEETRVPAR